MTQSTSPYGIVVTLSWLAAIVYATIPAYWLLVHPFVDFWRARGATLKRVGPLWALLWLLAGLATHPWLHVFLYRTPLAWLPGGLLILAALAIYYGARHGFTMDQVLGRSELEPDKHEQRLATSGLRARIRHPLYLAHLCDLLGLTIGTGSLALFALTAFALPTGALMIWMEERELERRFGDDYRTYKQRGRALLLGHDWFILATIFFFVGGFLYSLLVENKVGPGAFFAELFIKVIFPSLSLLVVYQEARAWRRGGVPPRLGEMAITALCVFVASGFMYGFAQQVKYQHRLARVADAISVHVGCRTITDPNAVRQVVASIRSSQWFSPMTHGWSADIPLVLRLQSGTDEYLYLSDAAPNQSAVLVGQHGLFISKSLADALVRAGAWQIKRTDNEQGTFYVVVPESVCLQEAR